MLMLFLCYLSWLSSLIVFFSLFSVGRSRHSRRVSGVPTLPRGPRTPPRPLHAPLSRIGHDIKPRARQFSAFLHRLPQVNAAVHACCGANVNSRRIKRIHIEHTENPRGVWRGGGCADGSAVSVRVVQLRGARRRCRSLRLFSVRNPGLWEWCHPLTHPVGRIGGLTHL